ncbi:MAG: heme-binding protein, partial [Polyangiaceae bacterium]|nr:heme-binding protein [Polyangiaceae bacterium]
EAVSIGFRRLAGYIFGGNRPHQTIAMTTPVTVAGERIAMTAPVTVAGERIAMTTPVTVVGERIAMTAPVTVAGEPSRPGVSPSASWTITFTLPKGRDLASLPRPDDANVTLRDVPARRVAALRFAGRFKRPQIDARGRELAASLARAGVTTRGSIEAAGYDPPGVLPFLRRNEVWVELAD